MSQMLPKVLMLAASAVGVFSAGLIGTLGVRGRLNADTLGPLLGSAPPPAPAADAEHVEIAIPAAAQAPMPQGIDAELMPKVALPSPFSTDETVALFQDLEKTKADYRERLAALDQQQKDIDLVRADLNRWWDELSVREEQLEEKSKGLSAEKDEISGRTVVLEEAEIENLESLARKLEKMKSQSAAELLLQKDPAEVAKILGFVKDREAGKIMDNLPAEFVSKVASCAIGIIRPHKGNSAVDDGK